MERYGGKEKREEGQTGGGWVIRGVVRKALVRSLFSRTQKDVREEALQVSWRREFQVQRTTRSKALSGEYASVFKDSEAGSE